MAHLCFITSRDGPLVRNRVRKSWTEVCLCLYQAIEGSKFAHVLLIFRSYARFRELENQVIGQKLVSTMDNGQIILRGDPYQAEKH